MEPPITHEAPTSTDLPWCPDATLKKIRDAEKDVRSSNKDRAELKKLYLELYNNLKKKPVEIKIRYGYGGKGGLRLVGTVNGPYFEIYRTWEHFCIKHQGFGISEAVLNHIAEKYKGVEWVLCRYEGKDVRYILICRLTDFDYDGIRDKLSQDDDVQIFLPEVKWRVKKTYEHDIMWPIQPSRSFGKK